MNVKDRMITLVLDDCSKQEFIEEINNAMILIDAEKKNVTAKIEIRQYSASEE